MFVPLALASLLGTCAPSVGPITMSALVVHESGARPFAIADNTTHRSYRPATQDEAVRLAGRLLGAGDTIDVGYAQIDSSNFATYGLDVRHAIEPCTNLATAARILQADYQRAERVYGAGQSALAHALSAYNSGNSWSGAGYAAAVYATAAALERRR